jgi:trk system potassium uptake protein TrkH
VRILLVIGIVGRMLRLFSLAFLAPFILAVVQGDWWDVVYFAGSGVATVMFGYLFALVFNLHALDKVSLYRAEALGVVAFTWVALALFGAMPYIFSGLSFVDALFESMSGFTTTGATILADFNHTDSFFLWRSMTQWFGGLGVIALFVIILPRLGIAGRQLFFAEASGAPGEAVSPSFRSASSRLWILYTGLTLLLIVLLAFAGMPVFDSVCNGLTTLSAGGFSPSATSIYGYQLPAAEWILSAFMLISGTSFPLLYLTFTRRPTALFRDTEFRFYAFFAIGGGLAIAAVLLAYTDWNGADVTVEHALRAGIFQATSVISSTGFASENYDLWVPSGKVLIIGLMIIGGCAGSAAGGPKAIRHLLVGRHVMRELMRTLHPRAIIAIRYKGKSVSDSVMNSIFLLVVLYIGSYFFFGLVLTLMGEDLVTAFSASIAAVGNVGPAFGEAGPMGSFAGFSDPAKLVMTVGMWIGRLEIVTVLALLHWHVWRNLRLRKIRA